MRNKSFSLVAVFLTLFVLGIVWSAYAKTVPIVPLPKKVDWQGGEFPLNGSLSIIISPKDTAGVGIAVRQLEKTLGEFASAVIDKEGIATRTIRIGFPQKNRRLREIAEAAGIWPLKNIGREGYGIAVRENQILVVANEAPGLFYGIQSLIQLVRGQSENRLPCLNIVDWPDFPFRAVSDDISRGPLPTMSFFKQQIRRYAEMKINTLTYYTENIVKTKSHGDFAPPGGGVTIEQFRELADYARRYHIDLIGNFQSFGHFEHILSYPQYAHLGEAGRMLTPTKEESYQLLSDIYSEMIPAFHSDYFIVNCDETWDLGRGASKKLVDSLGIAGLYSRHLNRLNEDLKKYNKKMIMWADIALEHPEIFEMLPKGVLLGTWNYGALESFDFMIEPLQKAGFNPIVCPGVLNSRRLMPDFEMSRTNIRNFIRDGKKHGVMGVLTTVWDDGGSALFSRDWYGVAYAADQMWHAGDESDRTWDDRFDLAIYGNSRPSIAAAIGKMIPITHLASTQEMNEAVFWNKTLPDLDSRLTINLNDWYVVKEICDQVDSILQNAEPRIYTTDIDYIKLSSKQYAFMAESKINAVKAAELYRTACLNQGNRELANTSLNEALHLLVEMRLQLDHLKALFQSAWLRENRIYYLNYILDKYDAKLSELDDAIIRLKGTIRDYSNGENLLPPDLVRLDIVESKSSYFSSWLMCGPFPNPQYTGKEVDYLISLGGEKAAHPTVWSEAEWPAGVKTRWRKFTSPTPKEIDLFDYYENNRKVIAYAYCRIESEKDQKVTATFGSNDGIEIILNGEQVFKKLVKRNLMADEDSCELNLKKGRNHLLLKIYQGNGGWGFSFQLPAVTVRNHDYKYRIVKTDS